MSVINRVLKDLDSKGAAPAPLVGVQVVQSNPAPARRISPWLALPLIAALAIAWWYASRPETATETPTPTPTETPMASPAPAQDATPQLRLSDTLSSPTPPLRTGGEGDNAVIPAKPEATAPRPPPAFAVAPAGAGRDAPLPVKLDTRLSEPRPAKVIKEMRPPSSAEQAEQAWRQATRLIELGRGHAALEGLEATLRLDPSHAPARQALIALSLEAGDTSRGETLLREGAQWHADDAWYTRGLGQLVLQRGDTAQAIAILKSGLGKGVDAGYWGLYAGALGKGGRHEEAARAYGEAARMNPTHGPWWIGLGVSLEHTGPRADAAAAYQRALQSKLDPEVRAFAARKAAELGAP